MGTFANAVAMCSVPKRKQIPPKKILLFINKDLINECLKIFIKVSKLIKIN